MAGASSRTQRRPGIRHFALVRPDLNWQREIGPENGTTKWDLTIQLSHFMFRCMRTTVTLDSAGRVLIPKSLRDALQLEAGDTLELQSEGEQVTLQPIRSASPMRKVQGVWLFKTGVPLSAAETDKILAGIRQQRGSEK